MLLPKQFAHFLLHAFDGVFDGLVRVDFEHQVHAALQVQTQIDFFMGPEAGAKCRKHVNRGGQNDRHDNNESPGQIFSTLISFQDPLADTPSNLDTINIGP